MSEDLGDASASNELNKVGPDFFAFYTEEIKKLLSPDEDFLPFSSSQASESEEKTRGGENSVNGHSLNGKASISDSNLFSQGISSEFSEFKREKLKLLLRQSVVSLSQEVDDMLDPVLAMRKLQSQLRSQKSLTKNKPATLCEEPPRKKTKLSSSSSSGSAIEVDDANPPENKTINDEKNTGSCRASSIETNTESKEGDNDLQFLLENNTASVESSIKIYSDDLFMTLEHMEQQLEGILDLLQSSNRLMTLPEKQQLQKLIQKLPSRNLDRVVEIIQRSKPFRKHNSDHIYVDIEEEDNVTLWRLYIYVKAVENARKLASV